MYKLVKFITKISYRDFSTYYLFCKNNKILIPVEIYNKNDNSTPSIYNTIKRILRACEFSVMGIKVYRFSGNNFYTYLTIKNNTVEFEVNISFKDGIQMSNETSAPIFVEDQVLESCGIEITKDMVMKALKDTE